MANVRIFPHSISKKITKEDRENWILQRFSSWENYVEEMNKMFNFNYESEKQFKNLFYFWHNRYCRTKSGDSSEGYDIEELETILDVLNFIHEKNEMVV